MNETEQLPADRDDFAAQATSATSSASSARSARSARSAGGRRRVRTSTIVWGAILLITAALVLAVRVIDPTLYDASFLVWSVIIVGAVLVLAGLIGAIVRAATRGSAVD